MLVFIAGKVIIAKQRRYYINILQLGIRRKSEVIILFRKKSLKKNIWNNDDLLSKTSVRNRVWRPTHYYKYKNIWDQEKNTAVWWVWVALYLNNE